MLSEQNTKIEIEMSPAICVMAQFSDKSTNEVIEILNENMPAIRYATDMAIAQVCHAVV